MDKNRTIKHSPKYEDYEELIMIDKIVRMSKSDDGEITYIHLTTGEILESEDSIKTLEARINA